MLQYQFRPIESWPGEATKFRHTSKFSASYSQTLDLLERELKHLGARNVVVQADVQPGDIKNDGMLRASARPATPRLILSFNSKHGPLSYPADRYSKWQDNLRAIALSLEALRTVDRYGVTRRAEQYKGWQRLPDKSNGGGMTIEEARRVIEQHSNGTRVEWREPYQSNAIRNAEVNTHPDRGGNPDDFKRVQQARQVLLGGAA